MKIKDYWGEACIITGGSLLTTCGVLSTPENPVAGPVLAVLGLVMVGIGVVMACLWAGIRRSKKRQLAGHIEIAKALGATEEQLALLRAKADNDR
jgi:hypothetical protein